MLLAAEQTCRPQVDFGCGYDDFDNFGSGVDADSPDGQRELPLAIFCRSDVSKDCKCPQRRWETNTWQRNQMYNNSVQVLY